MPICMASVCTKLIYYDNFLGGGGGGGGEGDSRGGGGKTGRYSALVMYGTVD